MKLSVRMEGREAFNAEYCIKETLDERLQGGSTLLLVNYPINMTLNCTDARKMQ